MDADVGIVGAGFAGLAAARRIRERGGTVRVHEARDRVGGRGGTRILADGTVLELGAAFVGPTQDRVLALADAHGVARLDTWDDGQALLALGTRRYRYRGIPVLRPHELVDFWRTQSRLEALAASVPVDAPWTAPGADALDQVTAEQWLARTSWSRPVRDAVRNVLLTVLTTDPADVSLLHLLWYWHAGGRWDELTPVVGGAQQWRLEGGPQALAERLAADVGGVSLGDPVRAVAQDADGVTIRTDAGTWRYGRVVVTTPPPLTRAIAFEPPLPVEREQLLQRVPMSAGTKVFAVYPEPFWRADGLNGQALADAGPLQGTFDTSPPDARVGVLTGFVEGHHADALWSMTPADRRSVLVAELVRYFGPRAADPVELIAHEWTTEPWSRGCLAHKPPGVWTRFRGGLRTPLGRVHFASAETADRWAGYLDGAIRSGERAADEAWSNNSGASTVRG